MSKHGKPIIINSFMSVDNKRMNNGTIKSCDGRIRRLIDNSYEFSNSTCFRNNDLYSLNKKYHSLGFLGLYGPLLKILTIY